MFAAIALGLDSLLAGIAAGPLITSRAWRRMFILAMGLCDGFASWAGYLVPHRPLQLPEFAIYTCCVALLIIGSVRSRLWLCGLPLFLSIDNLAAGVSVGQATLFGVNSTMMAALGITLGCYGRQLSRYILARPYPA